MAAMRWMTEERRSWQRFAASGRAFSAALALLVALPACAERAPEAAAAGGRAVNGATGVEAIRAFIATQAIDKSSPSWKLELAKPPQVAFDPTRKYYWILQTNQGSMKIELLTDVAPMHVSSTIYLTELGFYDDIIFHRVIPDFMAQGGDPTGTGRGNPGYQYAGEFSDKARHDRAGVLSMANAGPGTDGSQFFLTFTETESLDGRHTVFGRLVEGKGTLRELEKRGVRQPPNRPTEELKIERATIYVA